MAPPFLPLSSVFSIRMDMVHAVFQVENVDS